MIAYRQRGLRSAWQPAPKRWLYRARDESESVRISSYYIDYTHDDGGECIIHFPTWIGLGYE